MATVGYPDDCPDHNWTFLTNYTIVLSYVREHPEALQREVAKSLGLSEHGVQRIIKELELAGYLTLERISRHNRYHVHSDRPLRHPYWQHRTIGELLDALTPKVDWYPLGDA